MQAFHLQPVPVHVQSFEGQSPIVQVPPLQSMVHLPPGHCMVHVELGWHAIVQPPPRHVTVQFALSSQFVVHFPVVQESEHVLLSLQCVGQPSCAVIGQSRLHFSLAGQLHAVPLQVPAVPDDPDDDASSPASPDEPPPSVALPPPTVQSYVHAAIAAPHANAHTTIAARDTRRSYEQKKASAPANRRGGARASPGEEEESLGSRV
jgi:hypothetical protein